MALQSSSSPAMVRRRVLLMRVQARAAIDDLVISISTMKSI